MKKTIQYALVAGGILAVLALSNKIVQADDSICSMGCCSGMKTTSPVAEMSTNATPDLLTTCPVSGEKLNGEMGKPFVFAYKNQEVKLCCKSCKKDFDKDPEKYMAKIRAADKKLAP
jgi:YHS domain-containing protein